MGIDRREHYDVSNFSLNPYAQNLNKLAKLTTTRLDEDTAQYLFMAEEKGCLSRVLKIFIFVIALNHTKI